MKKIAILVSSIFVVLSGFFIAPADFAYAQTPPPPPAGTTAPAINDSSVENALSVGCKIMDSFSNCVLWFVYTVILQPTFSLVGITANILDFFLGYSLDSNAYRALFIEKGWALIRDISNVAFIFTLLYLAIRHILGMSAKKAIPTLIIVALLLNFSLFFTKVIIDAGNILARAFYKSIVIENDPNYANEDGYKSISLGLVDKINPQRLLSKALFSNTTNFTGEYSTQTGGQVGQTTPSLDSNMGYNFLIFFLAIGVNLTIAWVFLSVSLLFVGRVIGLWFMMIFSPIAFITLAVPGSGGFLKQLSFDTWKDTVLKLAFVAPVFVFFLYLIISFLSIMGDTISPTAGTDMFSNLMQVFIPFIFIIVLLQAAKKTAESMAGEFGSTVKSIVGKVAGMAAGGALGVTAFAGRKVVGGLASSALKSGNYNARIAENRKLLKESNDPVQKRLLQKELYSLQSTKSRLSNWKNSSFDIRNANESKMMGGFVGKVAGVTGKGLNMGMTGFGGKDFNVGKGSKESRDKYEKEKEKEKLKMAEDQSSVSFRERDEVIGRQRQDQLFALLDTKNEIKQGFEDETRAITTRLDELVQKPTLTSDEVIEVNKLEKRLDVGIPEEREKKLTEIDEKGKNIRNKKDEDFIKDEEKERRGLAADAVASRDIWGKMMGVDNKEIAHNIRSGKTSKTDAEKLLEAAQKAVKPEDKSKSTPPPTPPSPPTAP